MEEKEKMKASDEMEPHGQALYRDGAGLARDTSPNTPGGANIPHQRTNSPTGKPVVLWVPG